MARAGEFDDTIVWHKKPDALSACIRDMRFDIAERFGAANAYRAEIWCNTHITYRKCIDTASNENRNDFIKHVRSLPKCVNSPLPRDIEFDDIAQWVADQNLKELNGTFTRANNRNT